MTSRSGAFPRLAGKHKMHLNRANGNRIDWHCRDKSSRKIRNGDGPSAAKSGSIVGAGFRRLSCRQSAGCRMDRRLWKLCQNSRGRKNSNSASDIERDRRAIASQQIRENTPIIDCQHTEGPRIASHFGRQEFPCHGIGREAVGEPNRPRDSRRIDECLIRLVFRSSGRVFFAVYPEPVH
jgi:hypothetical protein